MLKYVVEGRAAMGPSFLKVIPGAVVPLAQSTTLPAVLFQKAHVQAMTRVLRVPVQVVENHTQNGMYHPYHQDVAGMMAESGAVTPCMMQAQQW